MSNTLEEQAVQINRQLKLIEKNGHRVSAIEYLTNQLLLAQIQVLQRWAENIEITRMQYSEAGFDLLKEGKRGAHKRAAEYGSKLDAIDPLLKAMKKNIAELSDQVKKQ